MKAASFDYQRPATLQAALRLLGDSAGSAKLMGGGQSLGPMLNLRLTRPKQVIDVSALAELRQVTQAGDAIRIGAAVTHAEIEDGVHAPLRGGVLQSVAAGIAYRAIRNRGTVGGSLAHADPAGDWPTALRALDTEITMTGPAGSRTVPLGAFIVDAYTTALGPGEMLTGISVPFSRRPCGGAYLKFEKRAGDFAVASVGVQLETADGGAVRRIAISLGAVGASPIRATAAEDVLHDTSAATSAIDEAERLVREAAEPFEDTRGSVEYKRHLAGVLFRRALAVAMDRARGKEVISRHL